VVVRAHPGLVHEVDPGPHLGGLPTQLGVGLGLPAGHRLRVLLLGPVQGPLRRQAELAQQPPTLTSDSRTPNSRRISSRTMARVHNAKANCNCRGSLPTTRVERRWSWAPDSVGGRPGIGRALRASSPPRGPWPASHRPRPGSCPAQRRRSRGGRPVRSGGRRGCGAAPGSGDPVCGRRPRASTDSTRSRLQSQLTCERFSNSGPDVNAHIWTFQTAGPSAATAG
jgi:hypothetical protein